jgi:REP element-mobilizing transposase RayT
MVKYGRRVCRMGRQAREYSQSGYYHAIYRGVGRQNIFEEEKDYIKKLDILHELKQEMGFEIYAYCLMTNHVHLLLKEHSIGDISIIMKRLLTKYAGWFNRKYERSGALFGSRYKSQPLENDASLLSVVRYIHQNPIKANMVCRPSDYKWSSYREYIDKSVLTDTYLILSMLGKGNFVEFHQEDEKGIHEVNDRVSKSEEYIRDRIIKIMNGRQAYEISLLPKNQRDDVIKLLRKEEGFSIRQIERATGISRGIISRVGM